MLLRAALIAVAVAAPVAAQDSLTVPPPVLVIDQDRLFGGSVIGQRLAEEIETRSAELAAENREIEARLTQEEQDLTDRRSTMPRDEFRALADAFDAKVQRIREEQDAKEREIARLRDSERQTFVNRVAPILSQLVRERGAVAVLDRRSVILAAESIDITDDAIERINEELGSTEPEGEGESSAAGDEESAQ